MAKKGSVQMCAEPFFVINNRKYLSVLETIETLGKRSEVCRHAALAAWPGQTFITKKDIFRHITWRELKICHIPRAELLGFLTDFQKIVSRWHMNKIFLFRVPQHGIFVTPEQAFCQTGGLTLCDRQRYHRRLKAQKGKNHPVSACRRVLWGDLWFLSV